MRVAEMREGGSKTDLMVWLQALDADAREFFEERAAILEYEAKLPRHEAEHKARRLTEDFLQRREDDHDTD
ncbi:hypothetical protein [Thiorhodococcus fuscus]|uniref:Uncharacterized protein n=1 Tax=Thiorhodococcus fuscus TaxID=527200 RepID=A0ABW4YAL9_9GAMM